VWTLGWVVGLVVVSVLLLVSGWDRRCLVGSGSRRWCRSFCRCGSWRHGVGVPDGTGVGVIVTVGVVVSRTWGALTQVSLRKH